MSLISPQSTLAIPASKVRIPALLYYPPWPPPSRPHPRHAELGEPLKDAATHDCAERRHTRPRVQQTVLQEPCALQVEGTGLVGRPRRPAVDEYRQVKLLGQGEKDTAATGFQPLIGYPPEDRVVPTQGALGRHLIEYLNEAEYDIGASRFLDPDRGGRSRGGIGHAFSYVYHRIMDGLKIPTVPIMVNTYYPPNQPTPKRCYDLGRTIRSAIEAWPTKARVAVLASGGLSHFVVDEELDQMTIKGLKEKDIVQLSQLPRERLNSGNSEARNWISLGGAAEHLDMELFDYVPCYRSPAGTGCAMAFAQWT